MLGGLSGTIAATATMPLDYAKTTIQCGSGHQLGKVLSETLREQGPQGLFAGMVSCHPLQHVSGMLCLYRPVGQV